MRARYYNPEIKRFMSEDILQGNILDSPSMNRYAYVNGNPISQIDPYGLSAESDSGMKKVHKVLDVIGLMPVLGDAVDGANGIIYLLEGDKGNAVLSGISVIPIIGDGIGKGIKWGREGVEVGEKLLIKNADKADEIRDGLKLDLQLFGNKGVGDVIEGTVNLTRQSVDDKLALYLLNMEHPVGGSKAKWFKEALGFTQDNIDDLAKQITFDPTKAVQTGVSEYGTKFNQTISITGANGNVIDVTFAWMKSVEDDVVRLVTAIPTKK